MTRYQVFLAGWLLGIAFGAVVGFALGALAGM